MKNILLFIIIIISIIFIGCENREHVNPLDEETNLDPDEWAPTGFIAEFIDIETIHLTWIDNSNYESGFKIERSVDDGVFNEFAVVDSNTTEFLDNDLNYGSLYKYRIKGFTEFHESNYNNSNIIKVIVPSPNNLTTEVIGDGNIKLSWLDNCDFESGYRIERSDNGTNFIVIAEIGADISVYTDNELNYGTVYIYRVIAFANSYESAYVITEINYWQDCDGSWDGSAFENECGCVGGTTNLLEDFCYGCTESIQAHNYNPEATIDDGSCEYYITVTSPSGCETWEMYNNYSITWDTANLEGNVGIRIAGGNIIIDNTENDGNYIWNVDYFESNYYSIRVYSVLNPDIYDDSYGYFTINDPNNDYITVINPNGCEIWYRNQTYLINWNDPTSYNGSMKVSVWNRSTDNLIELTTTNASSYSWTIPSSFVVGDDYHILVARVSNTSIYDTNNYAFSIN